MCRTISVVRHINYHVDMLTLQEFNYNSRSKAGQGEAKDNAKGHIGYDKCVSRYRFYPFTQPGPLVAASKAKMTDSAYTL